MSGSLFSETQCMYVCICYVGPMYNAYGDLIQVNCATDHDYTETVAGTAVRPNCELTLFRLQIGSTRVLR